MGLKKIRSMTGQFLCTHRARSAFGRFIHLLYFFKKAYTVALFKINRKDGPSKGVVWMQQFYHIMSKWID